MDRPTRSESRRPQRAGFTLLEVLAAILIFMLTFTAFAGQFNGLLRGQGESSRRIRAALIADEELVALESQLAVGQTPVVDEQEKDQEEFRITVTVEPWLPPLQLEPAPGTPGAESDDDAPPSLLAPTPENPDGVLRRLHVRVEWDEGIDTYAATRTTFALDREAANALLASAGLGEAPDSGVPE
ncbi:MAG: type IV pilus modification PilV family protein [Myxococcota bacterium]